MYPVYEAPTPVDIPKAKSEELALQAYSKALEKWETNKKTLHPGQKYKPEKPSLRRFAHKYTIGRDTLCRRFNSLCQPHHLSTQSQQRLTPIEEANLAGWIVLLAEWGFPPLVGRIRVQAEELLQARGDIRPLGINWIQKFMGRHPELESRFIQSIDKERINAVNYETVSHWFKLYSETVSKYQIQREDQYNMDKKGFALEQIGKQKVIVSKHRFDTVICQSGSREWVSLLECISADGVLLPAFMIFKAKRQQQAWMDVLERGNQIAISDKGWTNNELALEWFRRVFHPSTQKRQKGEYRLLIFDGHASHITTEAIKYCISEKIVLLYHPPHTTHKLQPLDVGFFQPLATLYQSKLMHLLRLDSSSNVDKVDFIELYQVARRQAAKESTILSAWDKAYLFPLDPERLLKTLPDRPKSTEGLNSSRPFTPPEVERIYRASDGVSASENLMIPESERVEWDRAVHRAKCEPSTATFDRLNKIRENVRIERDLQKSTARQLFQNQQRQDQKQQRSKKQLGTARVMSPEVLDERNDRAKQDQLQKVDQAKRKVKSKTDKAKRKQRAIKAKNNAIWPDKCFLRVIESIALLIGEERKFLSSKKQLNKTAATAPIIGLEPPMLAPLELSSLTQDPERPRDRKPQRGAKPKGKKAPIKHQSTGCKDRAIIAFSAPTRHTASGRAVKPPKNRD